MQLEHIHNVTFGPIAALQQNPEDKSLMEMKGICLDKMQQPKEAIEIFEKLFKVTQNPYHTLIS
jgi:tetratricopeptide (TPR) repeat protein